MKDYEKITILTLSGVLVLFLLSFIINIFSDLSFLDSVRITFGSVYVLFLPGFILSYVFFLKSKRFDSDEDGIDWIERIALSFALSIAIVPLAVFYLNIIGLKINTLNTFLTILVLIVIFSGILLWKKSRF